MPLLPLYSIASKNGIPMNITHIQRWTYLSIPGLSDINSCHQHTIRNKVDLGGLSLDLAMIAEQWKLMQLFNLGLDLVPSTK